MGHKWKAFLCCWLQFNGMNSMAFPSYYIQKICLPQNLDIILWYYPIFCDNYQIFRNSL